MKTLVILVILAVGGYFGWRYLPDSLKQPIVHKINSIGLPQIIPSNALATAKAKLLPENPVEKRASLIGQLSKNLETMASTQSATSLAGKVTFSDALKNSEAIISDLKSENPKSGALSEMTQRIVDAILPHPPMGQSCSTSTISQ